MRPIQPEGVFDGSNPGGQAAIVTAKQFAKGGGADKAFKGIRTTINGVAVALIEVGREVAANLAVMGQYPRPQFGVLALLTMARSVVRRLVQESRKLLEPRAEPEKLILALRDGQHRNGGC